MAVDKVDVAMMMGMLKMARIRGNKHYGDGYIDLAGYAACAAECSGIGTEIPPWAKLVEKEAEEVEKAFGKPDGGCCQNGKDHTIPPEEPAGNNPEKQDSSTGTEFKPGDRAQAFNGEEWVDCRYIRWKEPEGRHVVQYKGCMCSIDPESLRPVPRAEGCEELVQKDALREKRNEALLELRKVFLDSVNAKEEEKN